MCRFRFQILLTSITWLSFLSVSSAFILNCSYSMLSVWTQPSKYFCSAQVIDDGDRYVTYVSQNHLLGRSNDDVEGLLIGSDTSMKRLALGIEKFFQNLEVMEIVDGAVVEVAPEALIGLPKLRQISLVNNLLKTIDSRLFEHNPLLKAISFARNPIAHVGFNAFDNLTELTTFAFYDTVCTELYYDDRAVVETAIFNIKVYCPPTFDMIEADLLRSSNFQQQMSQRVMDRTDPMSEKVTEIEKSLIKLYVHIDQRVADRTEQLNQKLEQLEMSLNDSTLHFRQKLVVLDEQIDQRVAEQTDLLNSKILEVQQKLTELDFQIELRLAEQNETLNDKISEFEENFIQLDYQICQRLTDQAESINGQLEEAEQKIIELDAQTDQRLADKTATLNHRILGFEQKLINLEGQVNQRLLGQIELLNKKLTELTELDAQIHERLAEQLEPLTRKVEHLELKLSEVDAQIIRRVNDVVSVRMIEVERKLKTQISEAVDPILLEISKINRRLSTLENSLVPAGIIPQN